ncbi:hypothetical protein [Pseudomonas viridiflava]|uniref:hypothetical protein n=1 Tax=Pseudomonas viridiflava TaxID=33069 RepID=UPI001BCAB50E|nr:hypothetical protein [Pseudomonas viridiflava]QVI83404.1 hypothetical protein KHW14_13685 [Pseudomonas viridiflava]
MLFQFVTQVRFSLPLAVTENGAVFGAQANLGMFVSFPSRRILAWFHAAERLKTKEGTQRLMLPGPVPSFVTKLVWINAHGLTETHRTADLIDAFMELFYDYPVSVYGSQALVRHIPRPVFDLLVNDTVFRYNRYFMVAAGSSSAGVLDKLDSAPRLFN